MQVSTKRIATKTHLWLNMKNCKSQQCFQLWESIFVFPHGTVPEIEYVRMNFPLCRGTKLKKTGMPITVFYILGNVESATQLAEMLNNEGCNISGSTEEDGSE